MSVRYIYNTHGNYVAFVKDGYLFNTHGTWLGFVPRANEVYSKDGQFVGYLIDDDRIVRNTMEMPKLPIVPPIPPMPPLPPPWPPTRYPTSILPPNYEDVFQAIGITHLAPGPARDFSRFEQMQLLARDGLFLGNISKDRYDNNSISNRYTYGSPYEPNSIFNRYGKYGGKYSNQSPFNPYATEPPVIQNQGKPVAILSMNKYGSQHFEVVDPAALLLWLGTIVAA